MGGKAIAQVPNYVPTNGLVGWWPFNGNANDESGNGNNGTVNGATLTTDRFGNANKAYNYNFNNIRINNNPSLALQAGFTLSAWIKIDSLSYDQNTIISKYQNLDDSYSLHTYAYNPVIQIADSPGNWTICSDDNVISHSIWMNITATFDTTTNEMKLYQNGLLIHQCINESIIASSNADLVFGAFSDGYNNFSGDIDDIGIWNYALNPQEIVDFYNSSNCDYNLTITPIFNSIQIGNTASFSAITSDANATFTWQSDFGQGFQTLNNVGNYSGVNTNTLSIANVQLSEHNQPIRAILTSGNCIDTSNIAIIQIADTCITNLTDTTYITVTDTNVVTVYDTLLTTVTDTLIINTTLSLPAPNNENTILIYPNPASDHITIDNGNYTAMAGYTIKIENNAGQQVFQSAINQQQFYVDLSTWSGNGLYFVHIIDAQNNTVTVRKIVLQ